jgi:hypothetical protein
MKIRHFIAYYMVKDINFLYKLNKEIDLVIKSTNNFAKEDI